jgi:hypothetical protein
MASTCNHCITCMLDIIIDQNVNRSQLNSEVFTIAFVLSPNSGDIHPCCYLPAVKGESGT